MVLDVGEGKVPAHRKDGEPEDTWISMPHDIVMLPEGDKSWQLLMLFTVILTTLSLLCLT